MRLTAKPRCPKWVTRVGLIVRRSLPVLPEQQTLSGHSVCLKSAKRRHCGLFDDSIGTADQQHGDYDAERFSRHLIDEQLNLCDLLNRRKGRPFAL